MFKIISRPIGTIQCYVLQSDNGAEFEILSGYGAGLNAWRIPVNNSKNPIDLLFGYRAGDDIYKIAPDTNAGCRLSPFPGRTAFAKFKWKKQTYNLVNNVSWAPHALHGFLQNKEWIFESFESDDQSCSAVFSCDWPGAFDGFPFPFRAKNKIIFSGNSFTINSSVTNLGKKDLPYSEGWHPYFTLGEKINNLTLQLPESKRSILDSADIPTGDYEEDVRFLKGRTINNDFINDCFCLGKEFSEINITDYGIINKAHVTLESKSKKLDIWQRAGIEQYNAIQLYTPPDRKSIAIEPMTSEPDALNHHRGLIVIPPGETRDFSFGAEYIPKNA